MNHSTHLSRRTLVFGLPALALAPPARADLYDDYLNSTSKQPFVMFLARNGIPGHAFVGVGVQLSADLIVYERFFGYYPTGEDKLADAKLIFGKTSGALNYKWKDVSWDVTFRRDVDEKQKQAAIAVTDRWKGNDPKYNLFALGGKNCSAFVAEVAAAIGLTAPSGAGSMLPGSYIEKLRAANGG